MTTPFRDDEEAIRAEAARVERAARRDKRDRQLGVVAAVVALLILALATAGYMYFTERDLEKALPAQ